jgi:acetyltransferase-like isoleucine patch superfamily enzyme
MPDGLPIHIPQEYVNDDTVKLLRWFVEDGQHIDAGATIAEIETSKAVVELAAASSGNVFRRTKAGEEVRVGEIIGYISPKGTKAQQVAQGAAANQKGTSNSTVSAASSVRFSKKALELLRANGIAATVFDGRGLVREQDVCEYLEQQRALESVPIHFALEGVSLDRVSMPKQWTEIERGTIDEEFRASLRRNPAEFASLSATEKCEVYRKHGAVIGDGVILSPGSVIIAPQIVIGDRVHIGTDSSVDCRERFAAGQFTSFRAGFSVRGGTVVLGENIFGGGRVQIGGGGNGDPYSLLCIGDGSYVGDEVFINICRPVLIGKEVFVTQRSILVSHNIGHSVLEGYENRFAPIVLEDYAQVGMNSTIYAGSRVGSGSIVMSNSYVVSSIPPGKLAAGVPARVLREATRPLDRQRQREIVGTMIREYRDLLLHKGFDVSVLRHDGLPGFQLQHEGKYFRLEFAENDKASATDDSFDQLVLWTFENSGVEPLPRRVVMNLLAKTTRGVSGLFAESTREFLRKRGIRLEPGPWRYRGGLV